MLSETSYVWNVQDLCRAVCHRDIYVLEQTRGTKHHALRGLHELTKP